MGTRCAICGSETTGGDARGSILNVSPTGVSSFCSCGGGLPYCHTNSY